MPCLLDYQNGCLCPSWGLSLPPDRIRPRERIPDRIPTQASQWARARARPWPRGLSPPFRGPGPRLRFHSPPWAAVAAA